MAPLSLKSFRVLIILLGFVLVANQTVKAQTYGYIGLGYNMSFLQSDGLDYVISRYNETRTYLDEQMKDPRYFDGMAIHFGLSQNAFLFDFGYTQQSCVVGAEGVDLSGVVQRREVKNKWNTIDFGFGVSLGNSETKALALGVNVGLNSEKSLTRADTPDKIGVANFAQVQKQFKIGLSPFVQFAVCSEDGFGVIFKPYYAWSPVKTDYTELNKYINPYTAPGDPSPIEGTLKGFGITVMLAFIDAEE